MKRLVNAILVLPVIFLAVSCDYFYSMELENNFDKGIYIWSSATGLKTGNDPATLDELNDKWYLEYADAGQMCSFAFHTDGRYFRCRRNG